MEIFLLLITVLFPVVTIVNFDWVVKVGSATESPLARFLKIKSWKLAALLEVGLLALFFFGLSRT